MAGGREEVFDAFLVFSPPPLQMRGEAEEGGKTGFVRKCFENGVFDSVLENCRDQALYIPIQKGKISFGVRTFKKALSLSTHTHTCMDLFFCAEAKEGKEGVTAGSKTAAELESHHQHL